MLVQKLNLNANKSVNFEVFSVNDTFPVPPFCFLALEVLGDLDIEGQLTINHILSLLALTDISMQPSCSHASHYASC